MHYLGRTYTKKEILKYAGNIAQLAGVSRVRMDEGNADGARLIEVHNASGLEFSVIESRCMDIYRMRYREIPINFLSKNGLVYPLRTQPADEADTLKCLTGGMLYTCGTTNVGWACVDAGENLTCHGRIKAMSATNTCATGAWAGDEYEIRLYGEMRETSLFGENLALRRTITTKCGEPVMHILDEIENESFSEQPFMYMYHINLGFPMVDRETEVCVEPAEITCRDPATREYIKDYRKVNAPEIPGREECLTHALHKRGRVVTGAVNRRLGIGFYVAQDSLTMPFLHEWKANIAGAYALGLEPANCHCEGRVRERETYKTLKTLKPFERVRIMLEIGILEGDAQLNAFMRNYPVRKTIEGE